MKSRAYYLTRSIVRALFWLSIAGVIWFIATQLWFTGDSYCVGDALSCLK